MSDAAFWNRTANKYAKSPIPDETIYQEKLGITQNYLTPNSRVVELGCGTGTTALHHAPFAQHIDAWDISEKMLEIAKAKQAEKGISNVNFNCAAISTIKLPSEYYDLAMAHSILHLLADKEAVIQQIYDALKPGGIFISSTACLGNKMNWLKLIAKPMNLLGFWPCVYFFTSRQLESSMASAGFEIEKSWLPPKAVAHFFVARKPS